MPNSKNNNTNNSENKTVIKKNHKKIIIFITLFIICLIVGIITIIILNEDEEKKFKKPFIMAVNETASQIDSLGGTIKIYKSDDNNSNQRAVIVLPGGGYEFLAGDKEGSDWVPFLKSLGYTTALLRYAVPPKSPDGPLNEVIETMKYLRNTDNGWNVETGIIGVMGFSAGGHLAATAATHIKGDERPAFQVLYYPVITMEKKNTHKGSRKNLIGKDPSQELIDLYSNEKHVTAETPPAYISWNNNDRTVPIINSKMYIEALKSKGVPVHVKNYEKGGHGYSYRYYDEMIEDLTQWFISLNETDRKSVV